MKLQLTTPALPLSAYNAIHVHGCNYDKDGNLEETTDTADVWSVYLHLVEGGTECVADFSTREAADLVEEALRITLVDHHTKAGLSTEFLAFTSVEEAECMVVWYESDVKSLADALGIPITIEQCREVLLRAEAQHDANVGINYDVLEYHIKKVVK